MIHTPMTRTEDEFIALRQQFVAALESMVHKLTYANQTIRDQEMALRLADISIRKLRSKLRAVRHGKTPRKSPKKGGRR